MSEAPGMPLPVMLVEDIEAAQAGRALGQGFQHGRACGCDVMPVQAGKAGYRPSDMSTSRHVGISTSGQVALQTSARRSAKIGQIIGQNGKGSGWESVGKAVFPGLDCNCKRAQRSARIMPQTHLHDGEATSRLEPVRIDTLTGDLPDLVVELAAKAEGLGRALHPRTAANLADLVRLMNTYYSNLIEGHNTRPRDIERALAGTRDEDKRDLQQEAVAHYRVQERIDAGAAGGVLGDPAEPGFLRQLHRDFYAGASPAMLTIGGKDRQFAMTPGEWRRGSEQDVEIGVHLPPSSDRVPAFMDYFHLRFAFDPPAGRVLQGVGAGRAKRILAMATAHHRFNWIHPFPDGNGRVSRLMSHAMAHEAGIGAHGLWSVSRGLARGLAGGLEGRGEYKRHMAWADAIRQGDRDGRGHLSQHGLELFATWFLRVCLDQLSFMSDLFELDALARRLARYVERSETLAPESNRLIQEALTRGEFDRGEAGRITRLPERSARRILKQLVDEGLLASDTPKGAVSLRFPTDTLEALFPRLYA